MAGILAILFSLSIISLLCYIIKPWRFWHLQSEKRCLNPTSSSPELLTFRKHYDVLRSTIQCPDVLASTLYAKGIICGDIRDEAQLNSITVMKRCQGLLNAVERQIKNSPSQFHHFMNVLNEEPASQDLYSLLKHTYDEMADSQVATGLTHSIAANSPPLAIAVEGPSVTVSPQRSTSLRNRSVGEFMNIPPRLQIHVSNYQPLQIVKAITRDNPQSELKDDQLFKPTIAVLDAATGIPLKCVVTLEGDKDVPMNAVCFVRVSVRSAEADRPKKKSHQALYQIERKMQYDSRYTANGKLCIQFCFFQANTEYIIKFSIHSIFDSKEFECIGYTADSSVCVIHTVHQYCTVGRNAWKRPSLLEYSGPCTAKSFHEFMNFFTNLLFSGESEKIDFIASRIIGDRKAALDKKALTLIHQALEMLVNRGLVEEANAKLEAVHQMAKSPEVQNGLLLQAQAFRFQAFSLRLQGQFKEALEFIEKTRSIYLEAAPSCDTCCMFDEEARILEKLYKGNMNLQIRLRILRLLEHAIADSYHSEYWQCQAICVVHIHKAVFHLTRTPEELPESSDYVPTEEDLRLAECHLKAAPLDTLRTQIHTYRVAYYTAMCDLYWWRCDYGKSIEYAEQGKQLCIKGGFAILLPRLEARLERLAILVKEQESDIFDQLLKEYSQT